MSQKIITNNDGFTLVELLVAMVIAGIITAVMYTAFEGQIRGQISQDVSLKMHQSLRASMEMIGRDIRMAGCDPAESGDAEILTATAGELRMTMDLNDGGTGGPDGDVTDPGEDVRYVIANGHLCRDVGAGPQPIARHCDALNFVYLDDENDPTSDLDEIRAIEVSIVVRSADTANPGLLRSYTDNTTYRNLQGNQIFQAPGDQFRRFQLNTTVDCRNLF